MRTVYVEKRLSDSVLRLLKSGVICRYRLFNVKTSKSPHAILDIMKNEGNGHLAVRQTRKMPGDY
jgi:hypothetical protein